MGRRAATARFSATRVNLGALAGITAASLAGAAALAYVTFLLWPRWPAASAMDAPSLPVTVAGVPFNVPAAAVRVPFQRKPGAQARLDLAFRWPDLSPPEPAEKVKPSADSKAPDQIFVSIVGNTGALSLDERLRTIYPRYAAEKGFTSPSGLVGIAFRDGTPYQGEDILFDPGRPEHFLVRCTRDATSIPGTCLYERRIGSADLTARFPRDWLDNWQSVSAGLDKLLASLSPPTS
jgi:hypothetical protein